MSMDERDLIDDPKNPWKPRHGRNGRAPSSSTGHGEGVAVFGSLLLGFGVAAQTGSWYWVLIVVGATLLALGVYAALRGR